MYRQNEDNLSLGKQEVLKDGKEIIIRQSRSDEFSLKRSEIQVKSNLNKFMF